MTMSTERRKHLETLGPVETLSELLRIGKDEMNLAEFPMTSLSDKPASGETSLRFEDQIYDDRKKRLITRKRIIEGSKEYGLPTATDDAVILALIRLTQLKNAFSSREVDFTRLELITMLNWPNKGQSYDRIAQSLHRVAGVTYHFENSWWDNRRKAWTTKIFGIIDNVDLNDSRETDDQGVLFTSCIVWNQIILDSFQAGYLRSLDFQTRHELPACHQPANLPLHGQAVPPAAGMDVRPQGFRLRAYRPEQELRRRHADRASSAPPLIELETADFLEPLPEKERFIKKGREWSIRLVQKSCHVPASLAPPTSEAALPPLVTELVSRGVTRATAAELVRQHPAERIEAKLEVFDWLMEKQDKRIARSPAGYLVKSIADDYATPKGFESRAARQARAEAKRQADREAAEDRRRQREQAASDQARREAVDAYIKGLAPAERKALEAEALARADAEARQGYEQAPARLRATMLLGLLREHVGQFLGRKEFPAED